MKHSTGATQPPRTRHPMPPKIHTYGVTVEHSGAVLLKCKLPLELHPSLGGIIEAAKRGAEIVRPRRAHLVGAELRVTIDAPDRRSASVFAVVLGAEGASVRPWEDQLDIEAWLTTGQGRAPDEPIS